MSVTLTARPTSEALLSFAEVNFAYAGGAQILDSFSWDVKAGSFWAVLGPSGTGKTTLLNLAAGLIQPQSGSVRLRGRRVRGPHPEVGLMLQDYGLLPWFSARRNVEVALEMQGLSERDIAERTEIYLKRLGLEGVFEQFPLRLSGGQRQRVALARLLALEPEVLLLDEPFSAVDELTREHLQKRFFELNQSKTKVSIMVTHSVEEAALLADHILIIKNAPIQHYTVLDSPFSGTFPARDRPEFSAFTRSVRREMGLL